MKYADNQPCRECARCIEYQEAQKCSNCEGKTLQLFIRWMSAAFVVVVFLFVFAYRAKAAGNVLTSNVANVKAWNRTHLTYDTGTGEFSDTNFPTAAQAEAAKQTAEKIPTLYQEAIDAMETNLAPLRVRLNQQRARPVATLVMSAGPNAALDRRNLTFRIMSNEVGYVSGGLRLDFWVYGNNVLRSNPMMECDLSNIDCTLTNAAVFAWEHYGTNGVTIAHHGEDYECFKMSTTIPTTATNLSVYVNPWIGIGRPGQRFNFGNRRSRVNNVYTCTTNDLSYLGRFYSTNGTEIIDFKPYGDNGYLYWTEKDEQ